jgi:very-short-patch-repair endonuclease
MGFNEAYPAFIEQHVKARTGERLRRLKEGHGKAESMFLQKVWWPLFHNFEFLHPEYEVDDFKDGKRYLDFAYIRSGIRICFEIDGYGPHWRDTNRWQFADHLERQNQLVIDGWNVIRFSYDQVVERPRRCQQTIQQIIAKMLGEELDHLSLSFIEKEIVRFAMKKGDSFTPKEICEFLNRSEQSSRRLLAELVKKRILVPSSGQQRIRSYKLGAGVKNPFS